MPPRTNPEHTNEIIDRYFGDPVKRAVLDAFFRELMERGDATKIIVTVHGEFRVMEPNSFLKEIRDAKAGAYNQGQSDGPDSKNPYRDE